MELILAATKDGWTDDIGWIVMVGGGMVVALIAIVTDAWRKTSETKAKEESRREIAAYVAEGSMTAEDAAQILGVKLKGKKTAEIDRTKPPAS
jgi:hypothetical protein